MGIFLACLVAAGRLVAQDTAFINASALPSNGLQTNGPFALGLEFTVNFPVTVSQLGAYDATIGGSCAGFGTPVQVGIYSEASQSFISPTATFSGTSGTVVDNYRFQSIPNLTLNPGSYIVIAAGLGVPVAPLWNTAVAGVSPSLIHFDNGGGVLTLGRSMYGYGSQLGPVTYTDTGPNPQYAAGSFMFTASNSAACTFSFKLDEPCKTSAGVFTTNGALIRTLWCKTRYAAGTYASVWNGLDDGGNAVAPGPYQIRVLQHNTEYVWDGSIGNTSAEISGPTVHRGYWPIRDIAISGTNAFYVSGYDEGGYDFRTFVTTDPQHVKNAWYWISTGPNSVKSVPADINDLNWLWTAADSNRVYFACSATPNPANTTQANVNPGCIVACNVTDDSPFYFTNGVPIVNNGGNSPLPSGVYVGSQPGLTGLAVQQNGNLLAASVAPDNRVYLFNKVSGAAISNFSVSSPHRLNFSPDGSLWVTSASNVICFTNISVNAAAALTISNLSEALDVAVNPTNSSLILVADGGSSQQIKAFNNSGASLWTYGLAGGYQSNGVAVATNKFWFYDGENDGTFISFAPDGSFWVGDGANHRCMHFSAARAYLEQIMYQPHSWLACVDQSNPSRVFNQFMEFNVDYTKPLSQGWTLVNNWKANVDACHISWNEGIREVTDFPNGRTYALIDNNCMGGVQPYQEVVELAANQLRFTGLFPMVSATEGRWKSLGPDGSARASTFGATRWYEATLNGFDASNNPVWNPETLIASASQGSTDPVPRGNSFGNIRTTISTNNILISFDQSLNNGFHLGGITVGTTNWLWRASPAAQWMNGCGNYEISNGVVYAGDTVQAVDRQVIYGYHGEFFRSQGQACQIFHYLDDGLFVGQFGEATPGHSAYEGALPGSAGNNQCPSLVKTATGDYYVWGNDEAAHGPQRWHLANARTIRELVGTGSLGNVITLTNQPFGFPAGLIAKNGNQSVELSWNPLPGATSYNIRYSLLNGGPYGTFYRNTTNVDYVVGGLTNGQTYYFAVTAIVGGVEGIPSEQVAVNPFDTTQNVLCAGSMSEGQQFTPIVDVSSAAVGTGQPSFLGSEQDTGLLNPRELDYYGYGNLVNELPGSRGYLIYNWSGYEGNITNIPSGFTISTGTGWMDYNYLERQFRVDGNLGVTDGYVANPLASISIGVNDTNYHFLTVISPAQFNNPRYFTLRLTSTNNTSASFNVNEPMGYSHVFQFLFRGNVTLWGDGTGGSGAIVQALLFDDAPVTYSPPPSSRVIPSPRLNGASVLSNGGFQFSFNNTMDAGFTVLSATNPSLPLTNWTVVGAATNIAPGLFQFTSQKTPSDPYRFYIVRTP
jgi:hypothetical protein